MGTGIGSNHTQHTTTKAQPLTTLLNGLGTHNASDGAIWAGRAVAARRVVAEAAQGCIGQAVGGVGWCWQGGDFLHSAVGGVEVADTVARQHHTAFV